jgi:hypothetical protein
VAGITSKLEAWSRDGNVDRNSRISTITCDTTSVAKDGLNAQYHTLEGSLFNSRLPPAIRELIVLMMASPVPVPIRRSSIIGKSMDCDKRPC